MQQLLKFHLGDADGGRVALASDTSLVKKRIIFANTATPCLIVAVVAVVGVL